jgi:hypothetical protein
MRMVQARHRARLALESLAPGRISREPIPKDFDRDHAVETRVSGAIDFAHSSCAQRREDLIGTEMGSCCYLHPCVCRRRDLDDRDLNSKMQVLAKTCPAL